MALCSMTLVTIFALVAKNLVRGRVGRSWMAIRDMDIAAEIIGIRPFPTKLLAFSISSFYCGVAGAMMLFLWLGSAETEAFDINVSFEVLFVVIIGGLGSLRGTLLAAFVIGISDGVISVFFTPTLAKILATLLVSLVLVVRPAGLFGEKAP